MATRVSFSMLDFMAHGLYVMQRASTGKPYDASWRELKPSERRQLRAKIQVLYRDWLRQQRQVWRTPYLAKRQGRRIYKPRLRRWRGIGVHR
jgi:hypothetical protein